MDYFAITGLFSFLTGFPCAVVLFFNKPRTPIKVMWSFFSAGIGIWGLGSFFLFTTRDQEVALFWGRFINYFALTLPLFLIHAYTLLCNTWHKYKAWLILWSVAIVVYVVYCVIYPQEFITGVKPRDGFLFYPQGGAAFWGFLLYFFILTAWSIIQVLLEFNRVSVLTRNQYKYTIIFSIIGFMGGMSTFFYVVDIPIYPFAVIGIPILNLGMAYAMAKHQLMDFRLAFTRGLKYTLSISILLLLYIVTVWMVERLFASVIGYQGWVGSVTALLVIGLSVIPFRHVLQRFVDKLLFNRSLSELIDEHDLLKQELVRHQRYQMLSDFSRKVIQQLRDPLTTLSVYSYHLRGHLNDPAFLDKFALVYEKETKRLKALLDQLAQYADPSSLDFKVIDIRSIFIEVIQSVEDQCQKAKIKIYRHLPEASFDVMGDAIHLKQALFYFLSWSMNSCQGDGQIWLTMEYKSDMVEIGIKDTGRGMTSTEKTLVFDPVISAQSDHLELLARAQVIIKQHGGKVIIDSQENIGTEWVIQLPRYQQ